MKISTNKRALKLINNEWTNKVLDYRRTKKLLSAYIKPLINNLDTNDCIHAMFNQGRTLTGRLSSSTPLNLQNIPNRTEEGRQIRSLFIGKGDQKLLCFDFSQIELRLLAHFTQDKNLLFAYNSELDLHLNTACLLFDTQNPTKEQRFMGKTINFSIAYGSGPNNLSQALLEEGYCISVEDCAKFLFKFYESYPAIKEWKNQAISRAKFENKITTICGRIITFKNLHSPRWALMAFAEREVISAIIQGSAADIMKKCLIDLYVNYPDLEVIATVHDEILAEFNANIDINAIKRVMENSVKLNKVPLIVESKILNHWGEK